VTVVRSEAERLDEIIKFRILDAPTDREFDPYARMLAQLCGCEIGAMTLFHRERHWVKAVHGPLARANPEDHGFCPHTLLQSELLDVPDTLLDPRFSQSTLVTSAPFVRFYAGVALATRDGVKLGTLCVMSSRPGILTEQQRRLIVIAAAHISAQLELREATIALTNEKQQSATWALATQAANLRQDELMAMLVHDFKSPLTTLGLNASWLAEDSTLTGSLHDVAQEIVGATDMLAEMVGDLLNVSRSEAGQSILQERFVVDLSELARAATTRLRTVATERGQTLEVFGSARPALIEGDPKILTRVISNLVDNACKYAPRHSCIRVELKNHADRVELRVIDQGAGVPLAQRSAIFEKYFQVDPAARTRPSHGLGLAFCRLAVEAHRGTIEIEESATGCVFLLSLPK
jgi:signal transduction histidine kinase